MMCVIVTDQTPTPTKFLQYGKETGLFEEISNPFDSEFKRSTSSLREVSDGVNTRFAE